MDWIEHLRSDENVALRKIYTDYRQPCLHWLRSSLNINHEDGIEIFQMAVIILYDNVQKGKLRSLTGDIKSYIFSIARNKSLELHRKYKREIRQEEFSTPLKSYIVEESILEKENLEERIETSYKALQILGDPCKTLLQLYYYKSMKMEDISQLMGYKNAATTKNQKYKCLRRLQSIYQTHKIQNDSVG